MPPRLHGNNHQNGRLLLLGVLIASVLWGHRNFVVVDALATTRTTRTGTTSFSSSSKTQIAVRPIIAAHDVQALADLRFDEWIAGVYNDTSRAAFQAATADLYGERAERGAVAFLARQDDGTVMGAGELSPIELQGALRKTNLAESGNRNGNDQGPIAALYVTDVVTANQHRRKGVAQAIMQTMEDYTQEQSQGGGSSCLLLHVHSTNAHARAFYTKIGYSEKLPPILEECLDTNCLAENAGTVGQVLLCKSLSRVPQKTSKSSRRRGGRGFG